MSSAAVSWTNSVPDLKNSQADPLIESLLEPAAADTVDANNRAVRLQNRHDSVFALFRSQPEVMQCSFCHFTNFTCFMLSCIASVKCRS